MVSISTKFMVLRKCLSLPFIDWLIKIVWRPIVTTSHSSCNLLKRHSLAQPHNCSSPHPGTRMFMENAHVAQCANFYRGQFQTLHAGSLLKLLQALTANIARLLSAVRHAVCLPNSLLNYRLSTFDGLPRATDVGLSFPHLEISLFFIVNNWALQQLCD